MIQSSDGLIMRSGINGKRYCFEVGSVGFAVPLALGGSGHEKTQGWATLGWSRDLVELKSGPLLFCFVEFFEDLDGEFVEECLVFLESGFDGVAALGELLAVVGEP